MNQRYDLIDTLRGLTLISMCLYHGVWDAVYAFGAGLPWFEALPGYVWQQSICYSFILLSGLCWPLGRHQARRGLEIFLAGALVTAFSLCFMAGTEIIFGVLTFLGSAMLLWILLDKVAGNIKPQLGAAVNLAAFVLCRNINWGFLGFEDYNLYQLPAGLYDYGYLGAYIGFQPQQFVSADYYALLPWLFLYSAGVYGGKLLWPNSLQRASAAYCVPRNAPCAVGTASPLQESLLYRMLRWQVPCLSTLGRHSLVLYLVHQPVLWVLLTLFFRYKFL